MIESTPSYTAVTKGILATITTMTRSAGPETRVLGLYATSQSAEAAYDAWSEALESTAAPINSPWAGVDLIELNTRLNIAELDVAAQLSEDVVTVIGGMANGADGGTWTTTEALLAAEEAKFRADPEGYGLNPENPDEAELWDDREYPDHRIVALLRG